jgi:hypothetical protein
MSQREVKQWALDEYSVPYNTTVKYINKALRENTRILQEEMKDELGLALARFNHVYKVAMATNQVYAAIDALKEIMKLGGMHLVKGKGSENLPNGGTRKKIKLGDIDLEFE